MVVLNKLKMTKPKQPKRPNCLAFKTWTNQERKVILNLQFSAKDGEGWLDPFIGISGFLLRGDIGRLLSCRDFL